VKKISWLAVMDVIAFGFLIGQCIGRWGNFMNREAFGAATDVFCRMRLHVSEHYYLDVHPTFLYESLWNLGILIFLIVHEKMGRRKYDGQYFAFYLLLYGIGRAWIEGLRTDSLYIGSSGIRVSQALSAVLIICSAVYLFIQSRKPQPKEAMYVNAVAQGECADIETKPEE
jgi:phosphatidylglycerol:prolipoprotein diacylglycerol transferase